MITGLASNGVVACVPAPYELLENAPRRDASTRPRNRGKQIPGWTAAEAKLRKHWSLLGFKRVPSSDVFALSLSTRRPPMKAVMRKYVAGKYKRRSNAQISA